MTSQPTVLIVGGGPVGLVLACELRLHSVPVRVIDNRTGPTAQSRAIVVWPGSLELLRRIDAAEPLIAAGHRISDIVYYSANRRLAAVSLAGLKDTPYPFGVTIPQVRTEAVLTGLLAELGVEVESNTSLTELRVENGRPVAVLRGPDGSTHTVRPDWLVGADGAQSTVRGQLGIDFAPVGNEISFAICDATLAGDLSAAEMVYAYRGAGALGLAPLGGDTFRVAFAVSPEQSGNQLTDADFQQQLDRLSPVPARLTDMQWCTVFRARRRLAGTFRSGRVFLAGDAAHIFSAAGAQGMNTGIQDAVSLGWRLGAVITGALPAEILDEYEPERRAEAVRLSVVTARQTELGLLPRPSQRALRDGLVRAADRTGLLQQWAAPLMSQTDVTYRSGGPVSRLLRPGIRVGDRLPLFADPAPARPSQVSLLRPAVLLWPGRQPAPEWPDRLAAARQLLDRWLQPGIEVVDGTGRDLAAPLGATPRAVLVRPDSHVAALTDDLSPAGLIGMLRSAGYAQDRVPELSLATVGMAS
ncbi:FAD-dependent monooxygenase [Jatrophihabitans sp.]|uniref:FAD-dependent monooxygenase n=1 Tax=Jatrophihabitans sp. TaxID=1932789 RepID=UPI002C3C36DA|nr:FAD-dependent monooxygenase [Jatrophihabitans sp.]